MTNEEEAKDSNLDEKENRTRPLLCPEEWKDPEACKVIAEFHKPGLTKEDADIESDLEAFARHWKVKSSYDFKGEYHKLGAPYLEEPSAWDGYGRRPEKGRIPPIVIVDEVVIDEGIHLEERAQIVEEIHSERVVEKVHLEERLHVEVGSNVGKAMTDQLVVPERVYVEELQIEDTQQVVGDWSFGSQPTKDDRIERNQAAIKGEPSTTIDEAEASQAYAKETGGTTPDRVSKSMGERGKLHISEIIDITTIEMLSYTIIRTLWGKDIHVPIKKEGVVDIDVHIKGKDALINTNQLYFELPELVIWHIIYSHKGKPVLEIGRGVKNGMKLHYGGVIRLAMELYLGNLEAIKAKKLADKNLHKHLREGDYHQ